ncbi:hypothetical protein E2320_004500 [Naja naja]|nr:hypothetical protein E2320_004500 [Naja naja]
MMLQEPRGETDRAGHAHVFEWRVKRPLELSDSPEQSQFLAGLPEQFDQLSMGIAFPHQPTLLSPSSTHVHLSGPGSRDGPEWSIGFISLSEKQIAP